MVTEKSDILIIGSGASALTSAILLLRKGHSVTLLESHYKPGGYMHSFEKMGHTYDSGAHYVGALAEKEPFWALLNHLDAYDENVFVPLDEEAFDQFHFKNQKVTEIQYGKGYERVIDHFSSQFPDESESIKNFFNELKTVARNFPTYEFLVKYDQTALLNSLETSLKDVCQKHFKNPELLNAVYAHCGLHGVMPADVSFGLHSIIVDSLIRSGGYGFRGSGDSLVKQFVKTIEKLGGQIILNEKAVAFEVQNSKIQSVKTRRGRTYEAKQFIFSGHPKDMLDLVGTEYFKKPYISRIQNTPESTGILGIYGVGTRKAFSNIKRNYYQVGSHIPDHFPETLDMNDEPMLSFLTFPDREVGWDEDEVAFSMHAPQSAEWVKEWKDNKLYSKNDGYIDLKEKLSQKLFEGAEVFNFNIKENTLRYETSTNLTNRRFNTSPEGSAYGIYHSIRYTGARALSGRTKIDNLFVTGQNTLFPGIMAACIAGMRTTGFMVGIKEQIGLVRKLMDS